MTVFPSITSTIIPLDLNHIDTDMIIPAQFLIKTSRQGYGKFLFQGLRNKDPNFVLNKPIYQSSQILVTRANFGCGSSREHAVWALMQYGIKAVIAESFSDIFFNNAAKNNLLLIQLTAHEVIELLKSQVQSTVKISLAEQTVITNTGINFRFDYDPFRKACLLKGYSDLDYLMEATA